MTGDASSGWPGCFGAVLAGGWSTGIRRRWLGMLVGLACLTPGLVVRAADKPILAHYMPWYGAKPHSADWGWHWTMNHFNPHVADGTGRRPIAARHYPVIGPYDSADPVVLEYHWLLMKLQSTADLMQPDWVTVRTLPSARDHPLVELDLPAGSEAVFVRLRVPSVN